MSCGEPDTPSNGVANYTMTTEGSTVVYSCDPGFVLCGDENRTCISIPISGLLSAFTGFWSGSVPMCISELYVCIISMLMFRYFFAGVEASFEHTSYTAKEGDGFADITVLLDQPSCANITVLVVPKEQSPVDASSKN